MTVPQSAGYYGLQLSEEVEKRICKGGKKEHYMLLADLTSYLAMDKDEFVSLYYPDEIDREIDQLSESNKIAFIRWIGDRLAHLHTLPVQEVKS